MSECLMTERDWIDDNFGRVCPLDRTRFADCDECSWRPLLKALTDATSEQRRIATAMLQGTYDCEHCSVTSDFGDEYHPCRVYEDVPYGFPCEHWTQRDKEA